MRETIEELLRDYHTTRQARRAVDRDAEPRAWAQADLDYAEAAAHLGNAVREAGRKLGLVRELGRVLGGTGYAVAHLTFDSTTARLVVELEGSPTTPAERRKAADSTIHDRVRGITDDFYSRTGVEVEFPYDLLAS